VRFNALYFNGRLAPAGFSARINYNLGALGQAYVWPQNDLTEGPAPVCAGDSVRLGEYFSEPGVSYLWQPAAGLSCTTCHAPKAAPNQTTTYTLYTTSTNACGLPADTATVTVTIQPPTAVSINLGGARTICAGDSLTLGVVPVKDVVYAWNTDATTPSIGIRPAQTTTYILQAEDTSGACGAVLVIDSVVVTVLPRSVLTATLPPDTALCPGETLTLTPTLTGTGTVLWSTGATTPTLVVEPIETTTYSLTFIGTACDTQDTARIVVAVLPADAPRCKVENIADALPPQVRVYPNPTTGPLTVELAPGLRTDVDLLNAIGQGILRLTNQQGTLRLDLTPYPDGAYTLIIKGQRTRIVLRK
jgi:hypothetical protein